MFIGLAMAELASAAPTSGGVRVNNSCNNGNIFSLYIISSTFGRTHFLVHVGEIYSAG